MRARALSEAEGVVDAGRDGMDIPAIGVFGVVWKSAFRLVLERVARRVLRAEEAVVGRLGAGALEEDGKEAVSALVVFAAAAATVVDWGWCLKMGDEGRVIDDALGSVVSALRRRCVWGASSCSCCFCRRGWPCIWACCPWLGLCFRD